MRASRRLRRASGAFSLPGSTTRFWMAKRGALFFEAMGEVLLEFARAELRDASDDAARVNIVCRIAWRGRENCQFLTAG